MSEMPRKRCCRKGRHRWGLWMGSEWHGLPTWLIGNPTVVCRYCPARGILHRRGVTTTSGVGATRSKLLDDLMASPPGGDTTGSEET